MDDTFPNRSGHDNDHDMNDIKDRLTVMEKYIYDIKAMQTVMPQHTIDIEESKRQINNINLSIKKLVYVVDKLSDNL